MAYVLIGRPASSVHTASVALTTSRLSRFPWPMRTPNSAVKPLSVTVTSVSRLVGAIAGVTRPRTNATEPTSAPLVRYRARIERRAHATARLGRHEANGQIRYTARSHWGRFTLAVVVAPPKHILRALTPLRYNLKFLQGLVLAYTGVRNEGAGQKVLLTRALSRERVTGCGGLDLVGGEVEVSFWR